MNMDIVTTLESRYPSFCDDPDPKKRRKLYLFLIEIPSLLTIVLSFCPSDSEYSVTDCATIATLAT